MTLTSQATIFIVMIRDSTADDCSDLSKEDNNRPTKLTSSSNNLSLNKDSIFAVNDVVGICDDVQASATARRCSATCWSDEIAEVLANISFQ
jgi:hypothetical protein